MEIDKFHKETGSRLKYFKSDKGSIGPGDRSYTVREMVRARYWFCFVRQ